MRPPTIGVAIPVGPEREFARWLDMCISSVLTQTHRPHAVVLVDDMHDLPEDLGRPVEIWRPPWRLGVTGAFNMGAALCHQRGCDLALTLGADDWLDPECLARIVETYEEHDRADGYYWLDVRYSDGRGDQALPCNAAALTPGLMRATGGFPPESGTSPDGALISILMVHFKRPNRLIHVEGGPYYNHRIHPGQESARGQPGIIPDRDWLTRTWRKPQWGRYQ